jgi:hexosaminidase
MKLEMNKNRFITLLSVFFALAMSIGNAGTPSLIPIPAEMTVQSGDFTLQADTPILADSASMATAQFLTKQLNKSTGYRLMPQTPGNDVGAPGGILLAIDAGQTNLGTEGYTLTVTTNAVAIRAATSAGLFYAVQTLLQLLPPQVLGSQPVTSLAWTVPCVQIEDQPRFPWRGYMLDVSRHFFTKQEIETILDVMAQRKMNLFHWHLVDDHGWRIEIKKYPKLTEVGAWRKDIGFNLDPQASTTYGPDGRYGGFYTQDDIREIVAYATARHITVLPEIEMPGHSLAALTAYPEFGCVGKTFAIPAQLGIFDGIYCTGEAGSYEFLQNVLTEVFQLFPCSYIHIGGDEVPTNNWAACPRDQAVIKREGLKDASQLESYFIRRMAKFIEAHGHTLVGWSEIMHGGLAPGAVVMDWIGGGAEAARAGHDVVMASSKSLYLCYYPSLDRPPQLRAYREYLPLQQVYAYEPIPANLEAQYQSHILGAEACVWTPDIAGMRDAEEMTFPRLSAVAEVVWSPASSRNWNDFSRRLPAEYQRLDACGIHYWRDRGVEIGRWSPRQIGAADTVLQWEATPAVTVPGKYRLSLNFLKGSHGLNIHWAALRADGQEIARDTHAGWTGTESREDRVATDWNYYFDVPAVNKGARYTVQASVSGAGKKECSGVVFLGLDRSAGK